MKKVAHFIAFLFFLLFAGIFALIPFRILYIISDGVFVILYHLAGYRKKVVSQNLARSFPDKEKAELKKIEKAYFRHLSDLLVESVKGFTMPKKSVIRRHRLSDNGMGNAYTKQNQSFMVVVGHFNNWEWGSMSGGLQLNAPVMVLYKPLSNPFIDRFLEKRRKSFGSELVSIRQTARAFEKRKNEPYAYILAADQNPGKTKNVHWVRFLNQDTACLHGPETYARRYNLPVIYLEIQKVKRGHYVMIPELLTNNPSELPEGEIIRRYMKSLEQSIRKQPEFWLWSHRRWKKKNPENVKPMTL
ncbi:MAG: lysophospholipid acyltransferase family protein [Bacteroidales bacterium]|nr:lysophospholipid acyltransferase family protein [Bacteroidales bacterium]